MEGTIKIEAIHGLGLSIEMDVHNISRFDMLAVFDGLAKGFKLDEGDRKTMGLLFAAGGLNAIGGTKTVNIELDEEMISVLEKLKENKNETDAH